MIDPTVRPNGQKIKALRLARKWSQEDLAREAVCGKRTVENAEAGRRIKESGLKDIANTLGVEVAALVLQDSPAARAGGEADEPADGGGVAVQTGTAFIEVVINRAFNSYTPEEQERLLRAIGGLLEIDGDVRVLRKRPGSVKLTLELTPEQAERLLWAIRAGQLEEYDVADATVLAIATGSPACLALRRSSHPLLHRLEVEETDSVVTLRGTVTSFYLKQMAQELVRPHLNGRRLINNVDVVTDR